MKAAELTGNELRHAVYDVIRRELGVAALVRFIQENASGRGDWTAERGLAPPPTPDELKKIVDEWREGKQAQNE